MVLVNVCCGLGNQLFQYATGRRLAFVRNVPLKFDLTSFYAEQVVPGMQMFPRSYRLCEFDIQGEPASTEEIGRFTFRKLGRFHPNRSRGLRWRYARRYLPEYCGGMRVYQQGVNFDSRILRLAGNVYLEGFWQSEGYFRDCAELLKKELVLRNQATVERSLADLRSRRNGQRPLVAIQVRRGDVAHAHEVLKSLTHMPYELVSKDYLHAAMAAFGDNVTFLVFSESDEDIAWCHANLHASDIHFMRGNDDLCDFVAMSRCDHNIISNSSFGWWAAWLNPNPEKKIIAPRRWFRTAYAPDFDIHSLVPRDWTIL